MTLVDKVGWVAMMITVAYTCLGLPAQIRTNYLKRSTTGLSLFMMILLFFTFSSWVVYGFVKESADWYIITSNLPGALCILIILLQFLLYSRKNT